MSGKGREDYQQVFEEIIKTLEHEKGLTVNVKSFLLDYEVACWQALREVFGETVKIRGCWFFNILMISGLMERTFRLRTGVSFGRISGPTTLLSAGMVNLLRSQGMKPLINKKCLNKLSYCFP